MYTYKQLKTFSYKELVGECSLHKLSAKGKKAELITKLLDIEQKDVSAGKEAEGKAGSDERTGGKEENKEKVLSETNNMTIVMNQMMETQAAMMKQQVENQNMIMELMQSNTREAVSSKLECEDNPKSVMDRVLWMFEELDRRTLQMKEEITSDGKASVLKDMLEAIQRSEEKLSEMIGEKITIIENEGMKVEIMKHFTDLQGEIHKHKKSVLEICDREKEEQRGSKGLPTGISPPEFHGDPKTYPAWWEAFEATVHDNKLVSKFYKYRYLRQALKGEAAHCLDEFSPLVDHYDKAVEHVKTKYGQPRKIVRHIIASIIDIPAMQTDDLKSAQRYQDNIVGKVHTLKKYIPELNNPLDVLLLPILESKLSKVLKQDWERELVTNYKDDEFATLEKYMGWYSKEVRARETVGTITKPKDPKAESKSEACKERDRCPLNITSSCQGLPSHIQKGKTFCLICEKDYHRVDQCPSFKENTVEERWARVKEKSLCFLCLKKFHYGKPCEVNFKECGVQDCNRRHNSLLHNTKPESKQEEKESSKVTASSLLRSDKENQQHLNRSNSTNIMPSAAAFAVKGKKSCPVRVAFDTMCQDSFISERVAKELRLERKNLINLEVEGFGGEKTCFHTNRVEFGLSPTKKPEQIFQINALICKGRICAPLEPVDVDFTKCPHLKDLEIADRFPRGETDVDILIGLNHYLHLVSGEIIRHPSGDQQYPAAMKTVFDYVILGPNYLCRLPRKKSCLAVNVKNKVSELNADFEKLWRLDAIGITDKKVVYTNEEQKAIDQFEGTVQYQEGRYCVGLPFQVNAPKLKNNYYRTKKELESLEKRIVDSEERLAYDSSIMEYVKRGFARKATKEEAHKFRNETAYFIPHFAVVKTDRLTTKHRIVFRANARDALGNSLNDCLLAGPPLQPDLGQILLRFRTKPVAIMADIEKMFCQTAIREKDYRFQLFLWRNFEVLKQPIIYIMTSVMFGVKPAPFLAQKSVKHHIQQPEVKEKWPEACTMLEKLYVDDLCDGGDDEETVIRLIKDMTQVMQLGGWKLTKFISNSKQVMESLPEEDRRTNLMIPIVDNNYDLSDSATKALGIGWNVEKDCFKIQLSDKLKTKTLIMTKRNILSKVFQIFDVFGFYSAYTIRAKVLIQELWQMKISWDEELTGKIAESYIKWEEEIPLLENIEIPRCIIPRENRIAQLQLHGFSDASETAYGGMIFVRATDIDGTVTVNLLIAKARVAPLKRKSLPRLELLGGYIVAKLMSYVMESIEVPIEQVCFWMDSEIALGWISKPSCHWGTFVANRVQEIHDAHGMEKFLFVPGKENPADLLTRGMSVNDLADNNNYWHGPSWLKQSEEHWPQRKESEEIPEECLTETRKSTALITHVKPNCDILTRFEKLIKLVRVVAQILKWVNRIPRAVGGVLTAEDLKITLHTLIRCRQYVHFEEEMELLSTGKQITKKSSLISLDPIFDDRTKLMVVGGRIQHSLLPEETKHQIILPNKDVLTEKIIQDVHEKNHTPIETTFWLVREKYWVIHGRSTITSVVHKCLICKHADTVPLKAKMGELPPERVRVAPAFSHIGLDFTGPIFLKEGKTSRKGYICLFTCAHSRMIHLELTTSMDTEEFLQAFRRMLNRRGVCQTVTSDNQTSFIKASRVVEELDVAKAMKGCLEYEKLQRFCANKGIKWNFITERSPFRGGYWERLNRSLKGPLKKVLGRALLTYSEMLTVLTDIEASINQRPLTYQGTDPKDLTPLTPAHLALGRPLGPLPEVTSKTVKLTKRYQHIGQILQHFWNRWTREYIPSLQVRHKWYIDTDDIQLNDIVLITEDNTKRNTWPMGRVKKLIEGKDGVTRTVQLQTSKGTLTRPVQRLHMFEKYVPSIAEKENTNAEVNSEVPDPESLLTDEEAVLKDPEISQGGEDVSRASTTRSGRQIRAPSLFK